MEKIIGSAMMSCRPELLGEIHDVKIKRIAEGMQKISQMICQYKPQTIVLLTPQKMFANALTIHVQPRLKGNMSKYGLTDMVLGWPHVSINGLSPLVIIYLTACVESFMMAW